MISPQRDKLSVSHTYEAVCGVNLESACFYGHKVVCFLSCFFLLTHVTVMKNSELRILGCIMQLSFSELPDHFLLPRVITDRWKVISNRPDLRTMCLIPLICCLDLTFTGLLFQNPTQHYASSVSSIISVHMRSTRSSKQCNSVQLLLETKSNTLQLFIEA